MKRNQDTVKGKMMRSRKPILLEGSLVVEMKDGQQRMLTMSPWDGEVRHVGPGEAFGPVAVMPEKEFRANIKRVVSRSRYDTR